ncbi:hypothetical protein GCM10011428_82710 [Streptomyces violaceus]
MGQVYAAVDQDGVDGLTLIEPGYLMPHPTLPAVRTVEPATGATSCGARRSARCCCAIPV